MALTSGFFDSINGDRKYNAKQFGELFNGIITDGIFANIGDHFEVTALTEPAMKINVGTGRAWIDGCWVNNSSTYTINIPPAPASGSNYYYLFLKKDLNVLARTVTFELVQRPIDNPLTTDFSTYVISEENVKRLLLCYVEVPAGTSTITSANIHGLMQSSYITGPLATMSGKDLAKKIEDAWSTQVEKWRQEFTSWKEGLTVLVDDVDLPAIVARIEALRAASYVGGPYTAEVTKTNTGWTVTQNGNDYTINSEIDTSKDGSYLINETISPQNGAIFTESKYKTTVNRTETGYSINRELLAGE